MKTVGAFCSGEEPSGDPSGDPEETLSSEGSEDAETSPPCGASLWLGVKSHVFVPRDVFDFYFSQRRRFKRTYVTTRQLTTLKRSRPTLHPRNNNASSFQRYTSSTARENYLGSERSDETPQA